MVKDEKITMKEFHTHPRMQDRLEIDSNHVIIDKEAYWRVYESLFSSKPEIAPKQ